MHTGESHSHKRGHSTEEGVLLITDVGGASHIYHPKTIIQENDTICKTS